jgi:hypothetical protein
MREAGLVLGAIVESSLSPLLLRDAVREYCADSENNDAQR